MERELQPKPMKRHPREQAIPQPMTQAAAVLEASGPVKRSRSSQGLAGQALPAPGWSAPGPLGPKLEDSSPEILARQAEMVLYEPAVSKVHAEISVRMLKDPDVKAQYDRLVECSHLKRAGERKLTLPDLACMRATEIAKLDIVVQ